MPKQEKKPPKFKAKAKSRVNYEPLSVTTILREKEPLLTALNEAEHGYRSFAELNRAALNLMLEKLGSSFRLTLR